MTGVQTCALPIFSIKIRECPSNIIVKDIKGTLLFKPRLLKLQINNKKLFKDRKTHFNITTTFTIYTPITKTKGIRSYIISLIIYLQDLFIGFLVFRGYIGKII